MILITGVAGFIGFHVAIKRLEIGDIVEFVEFLGGVKPYGLDYINDIMIYKNSTNKSMFKVRELDCILFPELLEEKFDDITYYLSCDNNGVLEMREGLSTRPKSYMNYALIRL